MKISCPNCSAAYELDDSRVPPAGLSIKCPKCKNPFTVHRPKPGETQGRTVAKPGGPVPLPGQAGGPARPAAKPAAAKPAAKKPGGPVPLPGLGGEPAAEAPPLSFDAPGAVPLPGLEGGPSQPQPTPAEGGEDRVPLPGMGGDDEPGMESTAVDFRPPPPAPISMDIPGAVPLPGLDSPPPPRSAPPAPAEAPPDDPFASIDMDSPSDTAVDQKPLIVPDMDFPAVGEPPPPPPPSAPPAPSMDDVFSVDLPEPSAPPPPPPPKPAAPVDDGMNFDFVEAPAQKPSAPQGADMLDFVDEPSAPPPSEEKKPKRPPPPRVEQTADKPREEELSLSDEGSPEGHGEGGEPEDPKKAEKARKKKERAERAERDREERARRKALRGPGALSTKVLPALRDTAEALKQPRNAALLFAALVVVVVVVLGFRARRTPAGFFWVNKYMPSKREATQAEAKVIDHGLERLGEGDFAGAREAVASAAALLRVLPDDEEVKAFFVLASSELKLEYGQVGADWDQAKRIVMKAQRVPQNRARGAFALASDDVAKGKLYLAPLGDAQGADLESVWLYAKALVQGGEGPKAAQVLDNALKTRAGSAKLLLLRGLVAQQKGQLSEAAGFFQKALEKSPENGRALVELADVKLKQGDAKAAQDLLVKALDTDVRKSLDAAQEARANMIRGELSAAQHDGKTAEAAFDRAVSLDANSSDIREAYGTFRLNRREWDKAVRQFEAAIAGGNATAAVYAGAARGYLGTNRLLEADKQVNQAVAKDAGNAHYIYLQGRVADAIGKSEEAFRKYEAALQKKPDLAEALCAEGMVWASRNDKAKAREKLDAVLKTPEAGRSGAEEEAIGELALALGDKDAGKAAFQRALKLDSEDPLAHAGMGKALAAQGDLPGARKEMETALKEVDNDASLHYEYGSLLRRLGESDAALEALRKAVKLDSKDARFRARLGALLVERGQFEEAEGQLRQAVLMNDRYGEAQFFLARALAGRKNLSEAVDTMKKAIEAEPDSSDYSYHLGLIFEQGQQVQDAVDAFQKAIDKNGKNVDALEHLGLNLMVENRFNEAVAALKKGADIDPKRARLWAEVGDAEQQAGSLDGAIRDFQKALAMDATLSGAWTKLGVAYKDKDCKDCRVKAMDALKRAAHADPTDATAHHELGYMYKDDGKRREAIAEFKRYLELRPDAGDMSTVQDDIYYLQEEQRRAP